MALLLPMIVSDTVFQVRAGVSFSAAEVIGPIGGVVVLATATAAIGLAAAVLRAVAAKPPAAASIARP